MNYYFENFFIFLRFVFENTKNTLIEKNMTFYILQNYITKNEILYNITKYSKVYNKVINEISKCDFINSFYDTKLKELKKILSQIKKLHSSSNSIYI